MNTAARIVTGLIGLLHIYIMVLEMFFWQSQRAYNAFGTNPEYAAETLQLAANQGLYNGFLAAGLLWGVIHRNPTIAYQVRLFFLGCVAVAGLYGAWSVKISILFVQTIPASVGIALVLLAHRGQKSA